MEMQGQSCSLAVDESGMLVTDGWVIGKVLKVPMPPTPLAPWINSWEGLRYQIKHDTLPSAFASYFLPLVRF